MLALGKTRDPTGKPVKQPHDPSLAETCVKIETDIKTNRESLPDDQHVTLEALSHLTDKKVYIRSTHADAHDRHGDTLIPSCDSQEAAFGV